MDILIERADGVLTITLNRPDKKNAITAAMYQEMADAFFEAEKDASRARRADSRATAARSARATISKTS